MANSLVLRDKPANAKYAAKAIVSVNGDVEFTPAADPMTALNCEFENVEVAWYDNRIKVTIKAGTPAAITQAYLTGNAQDVIIEVAKRTDLTAD